jgi:hypothetical protein
MYNLIAKNNSVTPTCTRVPLFVFLGPYIVQQQCGDCSSSDGGGGSSTAAPAAAAAAAGQQQQSAAAADGGGWWRLIVDTQVHLY